MPDLLTQIRKPVEEEFNDFTAVFGNALDAEEGLLKMVTDHVRQRGGKRMRPLLVLLMVKALQEAKHGSIVKEVLKARDAIMQKTAFPQSALHAATALELLHTASLIHDDVVDESMERRGQESVNASFNNTTAVLSGDFILSTALNEISKTGDIRMVSVVARLGQTLSRGELQQLDFVSDTDLTEKKYFEIISKKTASLFEACCYLAALAVDCNDDDLRAACIFGHNAGIIFQIRDDIFDYVSDALTIGKPVGNDMREGKLTLPVLHALLKEPADSEMLVLAKKVKQRNASEEDIRSLIDFAIANGGIDYARQKMREYADKCYAFINRYVADESLNTALKHYVAYVEGRDM